MIRRYPSIFLLVFIIAGILLADQTRLPGWLFLLASLAFCAVGCWRLKRADTMSAASFLSLSVLFIASFHFAVAHYHHGPNHIVNFIENSQSYHIYGRVADWPDLKTDRTEIKISLDSIADTRTHRVHGSILLRVTDTTTSLQRGDRLNLRGRIYPIRQSGFATGFDYQRFLNLKGVFGMVYLSTLLDVQVDKTSRYALIPVVDDLRGAIRESLHQNLSPTNAALASGFLIGETRNIPTHIYHRFRDSGTLHLLAVSGSNVALVLLFLVFVMRPLQLSRQKRAAVLLAATLVFALLSYGEPSVIRASIMASLVILAGLLQRRYDLNNVIAAAAVIILLFDPAQLFDVGFQLSFGIAWGLIFALPRITVFFQPVRNRWWYRYLVFPFLVSLVAQVFSTGIIAFYFERIPLISPLANLIIVPLVAVAVVGILVVLVAHLILPLLGALVGSLLNLLLSLIVTIVDALGSESIPAAKIAGLSVWPILLFYALLLMTLWSLQAKGLRRVVVFATLMMVNLTLLVGIARSHLSSDADELNLVTIPGGVASVLCRTGGAPADLIVTGLTNRKYAIDERILAPCLNRLKVEALDAVFVLSADYAVVDDLLRLCRQFSAKRLYVSPPLETSFREVFATFGDASPNLQLEVLTRSKDYLGSSASAYYSTVSGLALCRAGMIVDFCDCLEPKHLSPAPALASRILVTGSLWRTTDDELAQLGHMGVGRIFCAKIAQTGPAESGQDPQPRPEDPLPELYDLRRLGLVKLALPRL